VLSFVRNTPQLSRLCLKSIWLIVLIAIFLVLADNSFASEDEKHYHVLYINSYHPGYIWSDDIEKGLTQYFQSSDEHIELSIEYLDSRRFPAPVLLDRQAAVMKTKYAGFPLDLIIVSDNAAFDFVMNNREELFPGIPMVFCGYNFFRPKKHPGLTNVTGVNEEINIEDLVKTALQVQPDLRTLAFILSTGDESSRIIAEITETLIVPKLITKFAIEILKDASMAEIRTRLSDLPPESALFLLGQTSDMGKGRPFTPVENGRLISAASPIPVYTPWNFHLNTGVIGGPVVTGYDQGREAGVLALRILNGEKADSIPIVMQSPSSNIYDYNALHKHNISPETLPKDSSLINEPFSFLKTYKLLVLNTAIVFALLTTLLLFLSINILRRKRVERELQLHKDQLEIIIENKTMQLMLEFNERHAAQQGLLELSALNTAIVTNTSLGILVYEDSGQCISTNFAAPDIVGASQDLLLQQNFNTIASWKESGLLEKALNTLKTGKEHKQQIPLTTTFGKSIWIDYTLSRILKNERPHLMLILEDITKRKKLAEELQQLATTDSLTACLNRRSFISSAEKEIKRAIRFHAPVAYLAMDLDHFKNINDTHGHAIGDQVLVNFAQSCQKELRDADLLGRLGGEEFSVLLIESGPNEASSIAERIRKSIEEQSLQTPNAEVHYSVSIGFSCLDGQGSLETLMINGDQALYRAKEAGRNRISK
jgi:diguanylate cyclase (GGDEF)-like protein/PAS domain S-box-containing protein